MNSWINKLTPHHLPFLFITYFIIHLTNITLIPIFNDEAIYLDWAWNHTNIPGHLFDSLIDAKQPLMIWIFAIFERIFPDPLFAGRLTSVLIGSFSMYGIYLLTKKLFNVHAAIAAGLLYTIIPFFVFYNRQALMEAAVACVGIWSGYVLFQLLEKPSTKNGIILGVILGIGYLVKSSSLLFIASSSILLITLILWKRRTEFIKPFLLKLTTFFCINFILFINPLFWKHSSINSRYSFTPAELITTPATTWLEHFSGLLFISLTYITPLVVIMALIGIVTLWRKKSQNVNVLFIFFSLTINFEVFSARAQDPRYVVAFTPFLIVPASYLLIQLWKGNALKKCVVIASFLLPLALTLTLIFQPAQYIIQMARFLPYLQTEMRYLAGQTSGYGVKEAVKYIEEHASPFTPNIVFIALNAGNPESAVSTHLSRNLSLYTLHIDASILPDIQKYNCMASEYPVFFVTREEQRSGLDLFFTLEKAFKNPYSNYSVGIYTLKKDCKGDTLVVSDLYKPVISAVSQIKSGTYQQPSPNSQYAPLQGF